MRCRYRRCTTEKPITPIVFRSFKARAEPPLTRSASPADLLFRLRDAAMHFGQYAGECDIRNRGLQFVPPSSHNISLALDHRIETRLSDLRCTITTLSTKIQNDRKPVPAWLMVSVHWVFQILLRSDNAAQTSDES
jgi:hypothetical protein